MHRGQPSSRRGRVGLLGYSPWGGPPTAATPPPLPTAGDTSPPLTAPPPHPPFQMVAEMHRKEKETKTSWVCPPPPKGKGPWVQMDIAKRWKIWQVMFTKVSKCEFLKEKMRFTYPNQEIFVHEFFCTRRHAPPLTPWHPPHNAHLSSTLARLRAFRQLTTPLTQAAHQDLGPQCGAGTCTYKTRSQRLVHFHRFGEPDIRSPNESRAPDLA